MYKLVVAVAALTLALTLTLCCNAVSADSVKEAEAEAGQNLQTCTDRFPPPVLPDPNVTNELANTTRWYVKYADGIYLNRSLDVFFACQEAGNRPPFDSPCWTVRVDGVQGDSISETSTIGAVGISISVQSTISSDFIGTSLLHFPNSETPALTVHWRPVLCDGKSYILQFSCLPEGDFGFQVFTNKPQLDASSIHEIQEYLKNAGFEDKLSGVTTYSASECTNEP